MRPVYLISGGITKFAKAHPTKDFRLMVKEAFDYASADLGGKLTPADIDGSIISYFSDHFTYQLKAGAMVQDFVGLCPKPMCASKAAARRAGFVCNRHGSRSPAAATKSLRPWASRR
jgi:acetyl-CoA acetyltransferase